MKEPFIVLSSWGGAQYFDWWMLVHFLGGLSLAYLCRVIGFSYFNTLILVGSVLVGWEVYEKFAHIAEPWSNTVLDIVIGVIGIWLAYKIVMFSNLSFNVLVLSVLLLSWLGLSAWGWSSWKSREAVDTITVVLEEEKEKPGDA